MCLLIFAHRSHPDYPLVVAANRDEFHARPTAASRFWPEYPAMLAGQDLNQGGTWMGITRTGRFAAITNYRDPVRTATAPRSRGELPLHYLTGELAPGPFLQAVAAQAEQYAGFNLLVGDRHSLWYLTNSLPAHERVPGCLPPGTYGLSNARLDTPWPKVIMGKNKLEAVLEQDPLAHRSLAAVVADRQLADPQTLRSQDLGSEMDLMLSAQFIVTGRYGTRSTTTLWTHRDGRASWRELNFDAQGKLSEQRREDFSLW